MSQALSVYEPAYQASFAAHTLALLGLKQHAELLEDLLFLQDFYSWMTTSEADWPQTFFDWFGGSASIARAEKSPQAELYKTDAFAPLRAKILARTPDRPERLEQAYFQASRPVDLIIETVEALWEPIAERDDWGPTQRALGPYRTSAASLCLVWFRRPTQNVTKGQS